MLGQWSAKAGSSLSSAKHRSRNGQETVARLGREGAGRICFNKLLKRGVPRNARFARPNVALDRLERLQSENSIRRRSRKDRGARSRFA